MTIEQLLAERNKQLANLEIENNGLRNALIQFVKDKKEWLELSKKYGLKSDYWEACESMINIAENVLKRKS